MWAVTASKDRKQVPQEERIAIARALQHLTNQRDEFGKRTWSQFSIGSKLGVSQESARRALSPVGVGPAIREGIEALMGMSIDEIVSRFGGEEESPAGSILDIAIGQLAQEHPEQATQIVTVAKGLAFDGLESAGLDRVKQAIWAAVVEAKGKSVVAARLAEDEAPLGRAAVKKGRK